MGLRRGTRFAAMVIAAFGVWLLASAPARAADPVVNPGSNFNATVTGGEPRRADVDLSAQAAEVVAELERTQGVPEHHPVVSVEPVLETQADPTLTRVVLRNLLDNAWKFTRETSAPRIQVGVTERDGERVFFVRDNGVGFEPRLAEHLFGIFRRGDRRAPLESAGIGLATVRRIVHRHGGRVWGEGSLDGGATFYFHFGRA